MLRRTTVANNVDAVALCAYPYLVVAGGYRAHGIAADVVVVVGTVIIIAEYRRLLGDEHQAFLINGEPEIAVAVHDDVVYF